MNKLCEIAELIKAWDKIEIFTHIHPDGDALGSSYALASAQKAASREYGLDDWLFGPPEQYVICHSPVPVMLVNPRADLFSLCD